MLSRERSPFRCASHFRSRQLAGRMRPADSATSAHRHRSSAHPERNHKILSQYFAGMNRPHAVLDHHTSPSVVVDDLDVLRTTRRPTKTQAELIVHADGVLACSPALQGL